MKKAAELLAKGLSQTLGGHTTVEQTARGGFALQQSHFENDKETYHDEWIQARTTGGQELAQVGDELYTRLYAGGVITPEQLKPLGITEKDVVGYVFQTVAALGDRTRLFADCTPPPDGDWQYTYKVTDTIASIELTRSLETFTYKGVPVFIHTFDICPVKT